MVPRKEMKISIDVKLTQQYGPFISACLFIILIFVSNLLMNSSWASILCLKRILPILLSQTIAL